MRFWTQFWTRFLTSFWMQFWTWTHFITTFLFPWYNFVASVSILSVFAKTNLRFCFKVFFHPAPLTRCSWGLQDILTVIEKSAPYKFELNWIEYLKLSDFWVLFIWDDVIPQCFGNKTTNGVKCCTGQHLSLFMFLSIRISIKEILTPTAGLPNRSRLHSSASTNYELPALHHKIEERAFSYAGPASWNSLPTELRSISDTTKFKTCLKTSF